MSAAGRYTCRSNDDETSCDLIVYIKNRFLRGLEDVSVDQGQKAKFECQMADKEAKVVWFVRGDRVLEGVDEKYDVKVLKNGVRQLIINDCQLLDAGDVKCQCQDLKTEAKLEVKAKEEPPEVKAKEDQEDAEGKLRGKYKGEEKSRNGHISPRIISPCLCEIQDHIFVPLLASAAKTQRCIFAHSVLSR